MALRLLLALALALLPVTTARANGGTVQVADAPAGPYTVTVLTTPNPILSGADLDVTVAVSDPQRVEDNMVPDAQVVVGAAPVGSAGDRPSYTATHEQATNKLLYQANVPITVAGSWNFTVRVSGPDGGGEVSFSAAAVRGPNVSGPLVFVYAAIPALLIAAAILVIWLRRRRAPGAS